MPSDARYTGEIEERDMRNILKISTAFAVLATSGVPVMAPASAHTTTYAHHHRYHGRTHYARRYCR